MATQGPLFVRSLIGQSNALLVALVVCWAACAAAAAQTATPPAPSSSSPSSTSSSSSKREQDPTPAEQPQDQSGSSSSRKSHGKVPHHVQVAEEEPPPPELAQAEAFIQKQDYAAAEPLLRKVLAGDSVDANASAGSNSSSASASNYVAWFELGFVENALGKVDDSIAAYRKSVAAKPDVFESNLNLGLQLAKTGQPDAAQFLLAATQLKPTSHVAEGKARAWLSLAHVLEPAKPDEAIAAYREAATLQPKDPEPHVAAGALLEKQNKFAEAETEYRQAVALDPSSDAVIGLANLYMRGRRFPEAADYLRKLIATHPERADAHIQLGQILADEDKNDEAIAELQTGVKLAPADFAAQRDLADLYFAMKKNDRAEAIYRALVGAKPDDADLHHALGKSLLEQKKFPDAEKEFMTAVKLKPDFGEAYGNLAFAASENKDYPLAIKALDVRAKLLPETAVIYFLRATAYDNLWRATAHGNSNDRKQAAANYHLFLKAANGKYPDQEWQATHRLLALEPRK
jgi:tetratricopeptide (TPR) repeat protein